jgi:predicted SprT family Zn-dependent metalloprotease
MMSLDYKQLLRDLIADYGTCGGIRAMATSRPELSVTQIAEIGQSVGLNPGTCRIQTARARGTVGSQQRTAIAVAVAPKITGFDHRAEAMAEIARCGDIAQAKYGVRPDPKVLWNVRGKVGGWARGSEQIRLNEHFAINEGKAYLSTVAHEYAHTVVHAMRHSVMMGLSPVMPRNSDWSAHGAVWKGVMLAFGKKPARCHQYASAATAGYTRKTIAAKCSCTTHMITPQRAAKVSQLRCKRCKSTLTLAIAA